MGKAFGGVFSTESLEAKIGSLKFLHYFLCGEYPHLYKELKNLDTLEELYKIHRLKMKIEQWDKEKYE